MTMTIAPMTHTNPYVGPRAYMDGERLYGRQRELRELLNLLIADRIVILYSPSGAGKTSLIQASLIPALKQKHFHVLPVARVRLQPPPESAQVLKKQNRYLLSLLMSLEAEVPQPEQLTPEQLATADLAEYLKQRSEVTGNEDEQVLIFDQFEEILTVEPTNLAAKMDFFEHIGKALRDKRLWALFSIREDYLAALDPYRNLLPTRLLNRFRLDLLGAEAAKLAISGPAHQAGVDFTAEATEKLVDDLRRARVQDLEGSSKWQAGLYVEPVQLQVVCRNLWQNLDPSTTRITAEDISAVEDVDTALANYYAESVRTIADERGLRERRIRTWFDKHLITPQKTRGMVPQDENESGGLDNTTIRALVNSHLVRAEQRHGSVWFELSHDRLIEPIHLNNANWRKANSQPWQAQAELWYGEGNPAGLLLGGEALDSAESWLASHHDEVLPVEREYLKASGEARRRRRIIRFSVISVVGVIVIALALVFSFYLNAEEQKRIAEDNTLLFRQQKKTAVALGYEANSQREGAKTAEAIADSRALLNRLSMQSLFHLDDRPDLALLLGVEAARLGDRVGDIVDVQAILLQALTQYPHLRAYLRGHPRSVNSISFSPDGTLLASAGCGEFNELGKTCLEGEVRFWDMKTSQMVGTPHLAHTGFIGTLAFSPDGKTLATGGEDGKVIFWDVALQKPTGQDLTTPQSVTSLTYSRDGNLLAITNETAPGQGSEVIVWNTATQERRSFAGHVGSVSSAAFSPDGQVLAAGGLDTSIILWSVANGEQVTTPLKGHKAAVTTVAFSPNGNLLASGGWDSNVVLWELDTYQPISPTLSGHTDKITNLAFSPDGNTLASASEDKTIILWDAARPRLIDQFTGHDDIVRTVAFSPDGTTLASGSGTNDRSIILWDVLTASALGETLASSPTGPGYSVTISPDSKTLAVTGNDNIIRLWDVATRQPVNMTLTSEGGPFFGVAFNMDGEIAAAHSDSTVVLWDLATGRPRNTKITGLDEVQAVAFSPTSPLLASGSCAARSGLDGTCREARVQLWDVANLQPAGQPLPGVITSVLSLAFSRDGKWLAAGTCASGSTGICRKGEVHIWDVTTRAPVRPPLEGYDGGVRSLAFSPDGKWLASGSCTRQELLETSCQEGEVRLWDTAGWQPGVLAGHGAEVVGVGFSPDNRMLASGSREAIILWDVATRQPLGTLITGRGNTLLSLAFSPDGKTLASGSVEGQVVLWAASPDEWLEKACAMANRNLSLEEWHNFYGSEPYRTTCPALPVGEGVPANP
jgi:WD40 repeat protein